MLPSTGLSLHSLRCPQDPAGHHVERTGYCSLVMIHTCVSTVFVSSWEWYKYPISGLKGSTETLTGNHMRDRYPFARLRSAQIFRELQYFRDNKAHLDGFVDEDL